MQIKLFNTQSIASLKGGLYSCSCFREHINKTQDVYFEAGAIKNAANALKKIVPPLSSVGVICKKDDFEFVGRELEKALVREGYRTHIVKLLTLEPTVKECSDIEFAENVRAIVGVGDDKIAQISKFKAQLMNAALVLIPLTPACINFLTPSAILFDGGIEQVFKATVPHAIIADTDILACSSPLESAAAFGSLASKLIALYDWRFAHDLNREVFCLDIYEQGLALIDEATNFLSRPSLRQKEISAVLCELNLKFSVLTQFMGNSRLLCGGEAQVAHALSILFKHEQRELKHKGENEFLFSRILVNIYKNALAKKGQFFIPPPDNNMRLEKLTEFFGLDESAAIARIRPVQKPSVLELSLYKIDEYKSELMLCIAMVENRLRAAWRIFKRLYEDDGFSLVKYFDETDVALCVSLAPDLKEKYTMLTFMKNAGYLDAYLIDLIA